VSPHDRRGSGLAPDMIVAALLTFGYIFGVAMAHDPAGWIALAR